MSFRTTTQSKTRNYVVKYGRIEARDITNAIHPTTKDLTDRAEWFVALEKSITQSGVRNPIVVTKKDGRIDARYGGSRLMIAHKHYLIVPVIVADFDGDFDGEIVERTAAAIVQFFHDPPKKVIFKSHGINVSGCADSHLNNTV